MSQIITLNEMYEDSDDGSSIYSMEGYDVNYLGPPPKYEEFPPFKEKPLPPKPVPFPLQLNKKEYFAFHEAIPHGELYCEYPHCSEIFLPYVLWGLRHHCRSCGMTVCEKHCTRNITLSSSIMPYYNGDLAELSTPILATSKNLNTLPDIVTLKYACLLCSDKALSSATVRRHSRSSVKSAEPSSALVGLQRQPSDRVSAEINRLQALLSEVRGELQARDQDVSQLAGQMDAYSQKTADLQKIIENLDLQLQVTRTEGRLSNAGRRKLKKLKKELMSLQSGHIDSVASSLSGSECGGDEDDTSSAADSRGSSRSRAMSLEGVNSTENAHTPEHGRTLDPFYHNVVTKASGPLSSAGEVASTSEPTSPAGAAKSALSRSSSTAASAGKLGSGRKVQLQVETEEIDKSSGRGQLESSVGAARGDDTQGSPVQHPVRTLSARVEYSDIYEGVHGRDSLEDMLDFDPVVDTLALQSVPDPSSAEALSDLPATGNTTADPPTSPSHMQGLGEFYALSTTSSVFCMLEDQDEGDEEVGDSSSWVRRPTTAATSSYPSETLSARDDLTYSTLTSSTDVATSSSMKSLTESAAAEATAETTGLLPAVLVAQSSNTQNPLRIKRKSHSSSVDSTA